jgi:hypothetical protein
MFKAPSYVIISGAFLIFTGIVFGYSLFFYPNSHPIDCVVKQRTGKDCPTCGFSRSFSTYTHFQFTEGKKFNPRSWPVFLFFAFQFIARLCVVTWYFLVRKNVSEVLIKYDLIISISGFLLAFLPLLINI